MKRKKKARKKAFFGLRKPARAVSLRVKRVVKAVVPKIATKRKRRKKQQIIEVLGSGITVRRR